MELRIVQENLCGIDHEGDGTRVAPNVPFSHPLETPVSTRTLATTYDPRRVKSAALLPFWVLVVCKRIGRHAAVVAHHCGQPMLSRRIVQWRPKWVSRPGIALLDALSGLQEARMAAIRLGLPTMFITRVRL